MLVPSSDVGLARDTGALIVGVGQRQRHDRPERLQDREDDVRARRGLTGRARTGLVAARRDLLRPLDEGEGAAGRQPDADDEEAGDERPHPADHGIRFQDGLKEADRVGGPSERM